MLGWGAGGGSGGGGARGDGSYVAKIEIVNIVIWPVMTGVRAQCIVHANFNRPIESNI